jgi:hypothetical protein
MASESSKVDEVVETRSEELSGEETLPPLTPFELTKYNAVRDLDSDNHT